MKKRQKQMSIKIGSLMLLDEDRPVVILDLPFDKPWEVSPGIQITYYWVCILDGDTQMIVELDRLSEIK